MKSKVDPLIKMLELKQRDAKQALAAAQTQLASLEAERDGLHMALRESADRFDQAQSAPLGPEEHELHHRWMKQMSTRLEGLIVKVAAAVRLVEARRQTLQEVHTELRSLELYKDNLQAGLLAVKKRSEALELDEIAGQRHGRKTTGNLS